MDIKKLFLVVFILNCSVAYSQFSISGEITDEENNPLIFINIILKNPNSNEFVSFTVSDHEGKYELQNVRKGNYLLHFSGLSYKNKTISAIFSKDTLIKVSLKDSIINIKEVVVKGHTPILIKGDTVVFNASSFMQGNEEFVEDLLQKLPGVQVGSKGTIKVNGREIEKLMVDGDDFFEKGYKILSKTMPVEPVHKIELLNNFSNNRLLKGIEKSEKVALNLKLKKDAKCNWFGNTNFTYGYNNHNLYNIQGNLMRFCERNKFYFISDLNNIGYDAIDDITHLIEPYKFNQEQTIGENQHTEEIVQMSNFSMGLKRNRTNFNNTKLLSLNTILKPSDKLKIKPICFFNRENTDFQREKTDKVNLDALNYTKRESRSLRNKKSIVFGKIDMTYDFSDNKMLNMVSKYNYDNTDKRSNLVFNDVPSKEKLINHNIFFDQAITFSSKLNNNNVFMLSGRYIKDQLPQNYKSNRFFYQELFPELNDANAIEQLTDNQMDFIGIEARIIGRQQNEDLLELSFGNKYRIDNFSSTFSLMEENVPLASPDNYQNNMIYNTNNIFVIPKYTFDSKHLEITGRLALHLLYNKLEIYEKSQTQNPLYVNPEIQFNWKIDKKNKLKTSYSHNISNSTITQVYNNYILTDFHNFNKGYGDFNQLNASTFLFHYQYGDWGGDRIFFNTHAIYNINHTFLSSSYLINENFIQSQNILIKNRELLSLSTSIDYFIKYIASNIKIDFGYTKTSYKNEVNNNFLRDVNSSNYLLGISVRSGFNSLFNYHLGAKWSTNIIRADTKQSFKRIFGFLDLYFHMSEKLNFKIKTDMYFFDKSYQQNNVFYFLDFRAKYELKQHKIDLSVIGRNLLNTEYYTTTSISDMGYSLANYKILPRYLLLKMNYKF